MIFVAGRKMDRLEDFPEAFQLVAGIIGDASDWLLWALSVPAERFWLSVRTGEELLTRMLEGLHGTALVSIDNKGQGLLVHPRKLMEIGNGDGVRKLEKIIAGEKGFRNILQAKGLMTQDDLQAGGRFLEKLGVDDNLTFQVMTLADRIQISALGREMETRGVRERLQKEAAGFALRSSLTPGEFGAGFRYYLAFAGKHAGIPNKRDARETGAGEVWEILSPLCNGLLETFSFARDYYWETLADSIKASLLNGFALGFLSKPAAICNIMKHSPYTHQEKTEAEMIITNYLTTARRTAEKGTLKTIRLSQDGLVRSYVFSEAGVNAVIDVDAWGIVTLSSCAPAMVQ